MALKLTANAKPDSKQRRSLFDDPERVRKDLERERRITRLQQVREKSNSLARQIREDVAAEKARQVEKYEQIKQQELNAWREHVVAKKHQDYRTAVFQVGAAHRAALAEIEKTEQQKQLRAKKMQRCRRLAAGKSQAQKSPASKLVRMQSGTFRNVEGRVTAGTQTPVQAAAAAAEDNGKENRLCNKNCEQKRKRQPCRCRNALSEGESGAEDLAGGQDTYSDSSSSNCDVQSRTTTDTGKLQKTQPIILDVDRESEDSLEICSIDGIEINDRHMQTNRKFSRIVQPIPAANSRPDVGTSRKRFTQISDLVQQLQPESGASGTSRCPEGRATSSDQTAAAELGTSSPRRTTTTSSRAGSPCRSATAPTSSSSPCRKTATISDSSKPCSPRSVTFQPEAQKRPAMRPNCKSSAPAKVIDAGIRRSSSSSAAKPKAQPSHVQSKEQSQKKQTSVPKKGHSEQPQKPATQQVPVQQPSTQQVPVQQPSAQQVPVQQPSAQQVPVQQQQQFIQQLRQQQTTIQQVPPGVALQQPPPTCTTQTAVSTSTGFVRPRPSTVAVAPSTGNRVEYYEHNNRYHRNYEEPPQAVQPNVADATDLNAMDYARIETQLSRMREQELQKLRKVSEERGQKALQREQVRRDCAELTEKLDALSQQQPQLLPSDANFVASHRFADLASRREQKMNEAMEQMLLRPAIVTCPEVGASSRHSPKKSKAHCKFQAAQAINLGEPPAEKPDDLVSTTSCCSMLLDYVDDQSKQLRSELKGMQSNSDKSVKLKNLLQRIEKIRSQLLAELKAGEMNEDNAQKVIESIRRERSDIHTLDDREIELQRKEALLEQRVKELYKQQAGKRHDDNPVEIIIKVKSDGTVKQYVPKKLPSDKVSSKDKTKANANTADEREETSDTRPTAPVASEREVTNQRQISIDSTSTSYRELPPVNYENIKTPATVPTATNAEPLHPRVAQYVQRLLGMSRSSIDQLGVSSSDAATPPPSIINQSPNRSGGSMERPDYQRVERAQAVIQDNRSFIIELEDTIREQRKEKQVGNEKERKDTRTWDKRLTITKKQMGQSNPEKEKQARAENTTRKERELPAEAAKNSAQINREQRTEREDPGRSNRTRTQRKDARSSVRSSDNIPTNKTRELASTTSSNLTEVSSRPAQVSELNNSSRAQRSSQESASRQMERYAQLTENCTQRIAELTDLITKVREEKQRLVEVTLTSASEGDRHSTEYFDLPPLQRQDHTGSGDSHNTTTQSNSEALPLQKNKPTGASLDSGISGSRPMTAMGGALEPLSDVDPATLGTTSTQSGAAQRRGKVPPATIRRYSPQLAEELPHELSTITEVDTPAQSHIAAPSQIAAPVPVPFPSFEQYAQELQLNLAQLNADQSLRLQHEFHELIQVIKQRGDGVDYREFPSIHAYLHDITANTTVTRVQVDTEQTIQQSVPSMPTDDLMKQLRLSHISIREFPDRREYMQQLLEQVPPEQRDMIDSASLEMESSDSLNVEEELRQRHLLKSPFRRGGMQETELASSTRRDSMLPDTTTNPPNESEIQPFSVTQTSKRQRQPQAKPQTKSLSSSSPESRTHHQRSAGGGLSPPQDVSQMGRALNLRDFLTRELLKHRKRNGGGSSTESTDDSLKSHFLQSVIDSLSGTSTPKTPALGHGTNATNDRQKTSTPMGSFITGQERSGSLLSSDAQLFSVESRISAVNYADGTPPVPYDLQHLSPSGDFQMHSSKPKTASRKNASRM
ncbi:hypothetical protein KR222_009587 [Zaprionus bogoriensis]|nr:hypothetical protein KR222_009587 [Zaprionus bogoriensis]